MQRSRQALLRLAVQRGRGIKKNRPRQGKACSGSNERGNCRIANKLLKSNLILEYESSSAGGFDDIADWVEVENGPVLIIEGNLAVMSLQQPVYAAVEDVHLVVKSFVVRA
jgi:hypothetical protein